MENKLLKTGLVGILALGLSGCGGATKEETQACLSQFETQIQSETSKYKNFSTDEKNIIKRGNKYITYDRGDVDSDKNFPKIINYVRENNSVDFRNRLSESLNVAISVEELTMQAYNTCGKDKGDIAQNYFETTMMPKYEEIIEKSISAGTVLGFALKSRDVISGKTKEDRKKKIKQRTEMLGNIYSVGKKFIEKSASDEQGYEVLKEKLRYISR